MDNKLKIVEGMMRKRHSEYALAPEWVATQEEVEEVLAGVLNLIPTHYNTQPVRMVLLTGDAHKRHWKLIEQILIDRIGEERYNKATRAKIEGSFASGVGTVVFFDDTTVTKKMMEDFPSYAHNFPRWAHQVQGSHQYGVWLGLSALGFGASLQHYIGMDDDKVREQLGVPHEWDFVAHMPFGKMLKRSPDLPKKPIDEVLKVIND
ncbi:MAG: nitroreductase family protein [Porphyromonas sp.]|nr:nitroreductase family protein [Porphyromonas sp.]